MVQDNVSFQGDRSKKIKSKTDARQRDSSKEKSTYLHNNSQSMSHESLETPIRDDDVIKEPLVGHQESYRTEPGSIAISHKTIFPDRATETNSVRSQYSVNSNVILRWLLSLKHMVSTGVEIGPQVFMIPCILHTQTIKL